MTFYDCSILRACFCGQNTSASRPDGEDGQSPSTSPPSQFNGSHEDPLGSPGYELTGLHAQIVPGFESALRDPPMTRLWLHNQGSRVVAWIDDPTEPDCPIPPRSLTFEQIDRDSALQVNEFHFPADLKNVPRDAIDPRFFAVRFDHSLCVGITASNTIVLQNIFRAIEPSTDPHIAEVALAVYSRDHAIRDLRYVFVTRIENLQTRQYAEHSLYSAWPPRWGHSRSWDYGTREYHELMGTRIGRTVGYLVLSGFARGSRRIRRILTWTVGAARDLEMRFEIEPVIAHAVTR